MKTIKRSVCTEELKSRIPGLFPYLERDEFGRIVKHKATDSADGCYGKIVPDFKGVAYRVLIDRYYAGETVPNIGDYRFEDVIGKFYTNRDSEYDESQTKVPEYVYAAEAKSLFDKMVKLKKSCVAKTLNSTFCCNCQTYEEMGGDKMLDFLLEVINKAETIASYVVDLFDSDSYVSFSVDLSETIYDLGYYTSIQIGECQKKVYYSSQTQEDIDAPLAMPNNENIGSIWKSEDEPTTVWVATRDFDVTGNGNIKWRILKKNDSTKVSGSTDSKLKSMRRYTTYIGDDGTAQLPEPGTDWLYFYRKGYVSNYETLNDENGNISFIDGEQMHIDTSSGYVTNMEAYGTVLTNIVRDSENKSITFEYYINAHLMAKPSKDSAGNIITGTDSDGNTLYYYDFPFVRESGGVRQTETYYYYEDSDLDEKNLSQEDFEKLISLYTINDGGMVEMDYAKMTNKKYEFFTACSDMVYTRDIFYNKADIRYINSDFEYAYKDDDFYDCHTIFKEDYLKGIHYIPSVFSNVNIQRGSNAAFERHIRLGEIKTLEDMENYQNGAFFNMQTLS